MTNLFDSNPGRYIDYHTKKLYNILHNIRLSKLKTLFFIPNRSISWYFLSVAFKQTNFMYDFKWNINWICKHKYSLQKIWFSYHSQKGFNCMGVRFLCNFHKYNFFYKTTPFWICKKNQKTPHKTLHLS